MAMTVDVRRLEVELAGRLGRKALKLEPVRVQCRWPVFRAVSPGCAATFVKLTERAFSERTLALLSAAEDCPFFPRPLLAEDFDFDGLSVLCLEWKDAVCVNAEDMTEGQFASFVDACKSMSDVLCRFGGAVRPVGEDAPERQYGVLADYAARHPLVGRLLRPILSIPESARTYEGCDCVTIHGDFQPKNYGFVGERFAAVFDFDALTKGLACEDAAYAFTERARRAELSAAARRRLEELFSRLVAMSPWSKRDWRIAVSHARLRIAARRLEKHPDSAFVAFDIARRDRPLQRLDAILEENRD